MKTQKEAERAEQQRIKNLVLNYELQDSSTDQTGTETDLYFDYFSHPNPNLSLRNPNTRPKAPLDMNILAHNDTSQGLGSGEKHLHNASLHQSSPANNTNARSENKSSSNRTGHRARKLQLSDVDWYDAKPGSSPSRGRGRGRGGPCHRGSYRDSRRTVG